MDKVTFNGELGFWDYLRIAFYTKFRPSKLAEVGPVRASLWALPNGKTFVRASPPLQQVRPLDGVGPLPMPAGSLVPGGFEGQLCTSASFELDDEFEAAIQRRDADMLAESSRPVAIDALSELLDPVLTEQKAAEDLVTASAGVDLIHTTTEKKE